MLYFYRPTIDWGRRLELGANTYRVLVHPTPPQAGFREFLLKPSLFVMRRSEDSSAGAASSLRAGVIDRPSISRGLYGACVRSFLGVSGSKLAVRGRRVRIRGSRAPRCCRAGRRVGRRLGGVRRCTS